MTSGSATLVAPRWRLHLPDPGRGWARYVPAVWPAADSWIDAPGERWGTSGGRVPFPAPIEDPLDEVLWLPPVSRTLSAERDAWATASARAGSTTVVQLFPGETPPAGCWPAWDLSECLLGGALPSAGDIPAGDHPPVALWPVLPGIELKEAERAKTFSTLSAAGVHALLVVRPELRPADRRQFSARVGEERYGAVFHGEAGARRAIARQARAAGLEPFPLRPPLQPGLTPAANRRVAEVCGLLGELWLRLGRAPEPGQALFSAMRAADRLPQSLTRLRDEGNLGVLPWLDPARRRVVEEVLATGGCRMLDELLVAYAGEKAR
jgi:hypothetical protein